MAIQIGKYKRPGIFIEEFDKSVITSPTVQGITNLVIGVSKKGPVNTPIRITNSNELESIFGQLDRGLERKKSFFHRTISKMLETSPVFAMNLLLTDDNLDKLEYQSLSSSPAYSNDIEREGPYRRFFDTTGFWKRDTESFINLTKNNTGYSERAFSITNLSDRYVSVFVFKSTVTGFDRTLLEWYGSIEKLPTYVNGLDFASDYLVDVLIVAGDWSNYQELAVDPRWVNCFSASGLRKDQVRNFANDRNVTSLAFYEGLSLIPYFRDLNGRNIFIETTINRDTDKTGVFCAFNNELIEKDYPNGLIDLIGNTISDGGKNEINFLSYRETITEDVLIESTPLDLPGNVTAMLGTYSFNNQTDHAYNWSGSLSDKPLTSGVVENTERTAWFAESSVYNVSLHSATPSIVTATTSISITYDVNPNGAYVIVGNQYVPISATATLTLNSTDYPFNTSIATYSVAFVVDTTGEIKTVATYAPDVNPSVNASDTVLGYLDLGIASQSFVAPQNFTVENISVDTNGFKDYSFGTNSTDDYYIYEVLPGYGDEIVIEFPGTNAVADTSNYEQYRKIKLFNRLVNLIDNSNKNQMSLVLNPNTYEKYSFENITISNIVQSSLFNKSFRLKTGLTSAQLSDILAGFFCVYTSDNEIILGTDGVESKSTIADFNSVGVSGKYSTLHQKFEDGLVNTGDYFFSNRMFLPYSGATYSATNLLNNGVDVYFVDGEEAPNGGLTQAYAGYNYIVFRSDVANWDNEIDLQTFEQLQFPGSTLNKGPFTLIVNPVNDFNGYTPHQIATSLGYGTGSYAYTVSEEVVYEELNDQMRINDYLVRHYLKMYLDGSNNLYTDFVESDLETPSYVAHKANNDFYIKSEKSNYKQTIECELPAGYVQVPNKILVNSARYTEIKVGDFLEAYYDPTTLAVGQYPRKLTRILSKRRYSGDLSLTEITCDSRILTRFTGDALQTNRFVTVDQYATTLKTIALKGFRIRTASMPDGTEERQTAILNTISKGTPLFKAITNKEAIDFRYLIDCFGLGLTEFSKQPLVDICGTRLDCFGFINMPSARDFRNSSSPAFTNTEGVLQMEYVAKGGDPESSPAFFYSFAKGPGVTSVGYFFPYVLINDNGRPLEHPSAPFVATTYMAKHISNIGNVTPWTIAAGVTNGRITGINSLELDFTLEDIEFLNQAQINPLVFKRNRGFVIETENTGQTLVKSALSYIHVREVLIELERELSRMLLDFQWRFNTPDIRAEIKLRADTICETYVSRNGLYNYFNKMDEENNTAELIDNQIGVLDTYVEPIKGMGIIVNNITILRTGAIEAGGFING